MKFIKGFDKYLQCRGFQFEIGREYKIESNRPLELCTDTGFHFCRSLQQVHTFYGAEEELSNRFCEIEVLGELVEDDEKCISNHIKIVREITGEELDKLKGLERGNAGLFNSGNLNSGYLNSGDRNSGDLNSGNLNSGDLNSGDRNSGDLNSGDLNSGNLNSGNLNSGYLNSGDRNSGNLNSGYLNSGDLNSGNLNSGNLNSGAFNQSNGNNGFFNTVEPTVYIFNRPTDMTQTDFYQSDYYRALTWATLPLTEWVDWTDEEKKDSFIRQAMGGRLIKRNYKEACAIWWSKTPDKQKEIIQSIPNFDKDVFKEITGIDLGEKK